MLQNYPNPFNPTTNIEYSLSVGSFVKIVVYNVLGEVVSNLVNNYESPGMHTVEFNGADLPSGVYFYRLRTNNLVQVRKMVLLK